MMLRTFIALELPPQVRQAIQQCLAPLRDSLPAGLVRWVPVENIHLTLKFLGDVSAGGLEQLAASLATEAAGHAPFTCQVGGLGAFPSPNRARVLWIGLQAPPVLAALAGSIEAAAVRHGYPAEPRPFSPHLTVGRVHQNAAPAELRRLPPALAGLEVGPLGSFQVLSVQVFKSDLLPGGARYSLLYSLPLHPEFPGTDPAPKP